MFRVCYHDGDGCEEFCRTDDDTMVSGDGGKCFLSVGYLLSDDVDGHVHGDRADGQVLSTSGIGEEVGVVLCGSVDCFCVWWVACLWSVSDSFGSVGQLAIFVSD